MLLETKYNVSYSELEYQHSFDKTRPVHEFMYSCSSIMNEVNNIPKYKRNLDFGNRTKIHLLGAVQVISPRGTNITPCGQKAKALIALIASSVRGERTRTWLCDKLWSDRDSKRANDSLRQTIRQIKKSFGKFSDKILDFGRISIRMCRLTTAVDIDTISNELINPNHTKNLDVERYGEFLEGLDVGDEEFEEWLTIERSRWEEVLFEIRNAARKSRKASVKAIASSTISGNARHLGEEEISFGIGLLPPVLINIPVEVEGLADSITEGIAHSLQELHPFDIYDYRDAADQKYGIPGKGGPDVLFRVRMRALGNNFEISFLATHSEKRELIWHHSIAANQSDLLKIESLTLSGFISQNVDKLSRQLFANERFRTGRTNRSGWKYGFNALNKIFSLEDDSMSSAEQLLLVASNYEDAAAYKGMLAYLSTFKVGEAYGIFDDEARETTRVILVQQQAEHPFNSVSLACLGHVCSYILKDYHVAEEFLSNAISLNPHQAFAWDHLALLKIYMGDYTAAKEASSKAVYLGSFSPLRYSYETTLAMACTLSGDYHTAIHYARRALARQPNFLAANRYLAVALGCANEIKEAESAGEKLLALDPQFADRAIQKQRFSINSKISKKVISDGLIKAGIN